MAVSKQHAQLVLAFGRSFFSGQLDDFKSLLIPLQLKKQLPKLQVSFFKARFG